MARALLIAVRFHDGRYHGMGDWPPSPGRLFQALVAGAATGGMIPPEQRVALKWLEGLAAPEIIAPKGRVGQPYKNYVPNNDLDAVGGDPGRIDKIRAPKLIRPRLFDSDVAFLYHWRFEGDAPEEKVIEALAGSLYQLGRGVDMAWATAELVDENKTEARCACHGGTRYRPSKGGEGTLLACPMEGTFASLEKRFKAMGARLSIEGKGRKAQQLFTQPPKARFAQVAYDCPPARLLFDLRETTSRKAQPGFASWPLHEVVKLVETLRDGAAYKLGKTLPPDQAAKVEPVFIGRNATEADKASRIRILPLPSIGHRYAERAIRRVLVEIPPDCPLGVRDIAWAFSVFAPHDAETGELAGWQLVEADDDRMLGHYGMKRDAHRLWRSVTPLALPERATRRRIDPAQKMAQAKGGDERAQEERCPNNAVRQALRHAGIDTPVETIRVQREPFAAKGASAETFAANTRFSKHRLWHVEITFATPRHGPLIIGDGRYLGLGLMAPEKTARRDVAMFVLDPANPVPITARADLLHALRRALMALDREVGGGEDKVSTLFSGHKPDGSPAGEGSHGHVFLAADAEGERLSRLYVIRPDLADRSASLKSWDKERFERVVTSLETLRAGALGVLRLGAARDPAPDDRLFGVAHRWTSITPYCPTRHAKKGADIAAFIERDVREECRRRGFPAPAQIEVEIPKSGRRVQVTIDFAIAVKGPILLGRGSHKGEGMFVRLE